MFVRIGGKSRWALYDFGAVALKTFRLPCYPFLMNNV